MKTKSGNIVKYNRWGYIFLIPFVVVFVVFQLIPLVTTIYNSFFEHFFAKGGLKEVGPNWVGLENYKSLFKNDPNIMTYFKNTMIMWVLGFVPQIAVAILLAYWFADPSLRLKGKAFFQSVIYMPNLIMASAFSMLFFSLFSLSGPINDIAQSLGIISKPFDFFASVGWTRGIVAFINFLMWFGNTAILLLAGMLGIDTSLYEAAQVDGATSSQVFFRITLPLLRPILIYVMITSLIGGLQMFDVPQILTNGSGNPARSTMTLVMYLNRNLFSKNYGIGGAISVLMFIITGVLSVIIFKFNTKKD
ncbi:MAG: sugar ABC transporter permease [Eubacterium sp.]|nr:sugar ABC transporter permease [Eubacterium sp.]